MNKAEAKKLLKNLIEIKFNLCFYRKNLINDKTLCEPKHEINKLDKLISRTDKEIDILWTAFNLWLKKG